MFYQRQLSNMGAMLSQAVSNGAHVANGVAALFIGEFAKSTLSSPGVLAATDSVLGRSYGSGRCKCCRVERGLHLLGSFAERGLLLQRYDSVLDCCDVRVSG